MVKSEETREPIMVLALQLTPFMMSWSYDVASVHSGHVGPLKLSSGDINFIDIVKDEFVVVLHMSLKSMN
jgi:hypothetical protein